ncbi:hypothetical protein MD484_g6954, partial [Candolleomyces efflorescens]
MSAALCRAVLFLALVSFSLAIAVKTTKPRPLVLWHGLGDSHSSPGMLQFMDMIKDVHPGIFIHSVYIDPELDNDRKAGFYGNVDEQVAFVSEQLAEISELGDGFDAIGFSQGGQFLRAYVERHNSPPVNNLLTFGSQHMGISDIPVCGRFDILCQIARRATKGAVYGEWAQTNLVQAQYFRDPRNYGTYLEANRFLTSINNERADSRNATYVKNFASLNKLVLVLFSKDKTVVPPESSWFGSEAIPEDDAAGGPRQERLSDVVIIPMRLQPLYLEDWIGLRQLDERGDVVFETCEGEHMDIGDCWKGLVEKFAGGQM